MTALRSMRFAFLVGDESVLADIEVDVTRDDPGVRITMHPSPTFGSRGVALGIAAAALQAGGGRYGDDADHDWTLRRVVSEYERLAEELTVAWAGMSHDNREALVLPSREALHAARAVASCAPGCEAELDALLRGETVSAALVNHVFEAAWRAGNAEAARIVVRSSPAAVAEDALMQVLNVVGLTGRLQGTFLVEKAEVFALVDDQVKRAFAARAPNLPDPDLRALVLRATAV